MSGTRAQVKAGTEPAGHGLLPLLVLTTLAFFFDRPTGAGALASCNDFGGQSRWMARSVGCVLAGNATDLREALERPDVDEVWVASEIDLSAPPYAFGELKDGDSFNPLKIGRGVLLRGVTPDARISGLHMLPARAITVNGAWLVMEGLSLVGLWQVDFAWEHMWGGYPDHLLSQAFATKAFSVTEGLWFRPQVESAVPVPPSLGSRGLRATMVPDLPDSTVVGASLIRRSSGLLLMDCTLMVALDPEFPWQLIKSAEDPNNIRYHRLAMQVAKVILSMNWNHWAESINGDNDVIGLNWPLPVLLPHPVDWLSAMSAHLLETAVGPYRLVNTTVSLTNKALAILPEPRAGEPQLFGQYVLDAQAPRADCQDYRGWAYNGTANVTMSGRPCLPWASISGLNFLDLEKFPGNHCRNNLATVNGVWCFVESGPQDEGATTPLSWEFCSVPVCQSSQRGCYSEAEVIILNQIMIGI